MFEWSQCGISQRARWCCKGVPWERSSSSECITRQKHTDWGCGRVKVRTKREKSMQREISSRGYSFLLRLQKFFIGVALGIYIQKTFHFLSLFFCFCQNLCELHIQMKTSAVQNGLIQDYKKKIIFLGPLISFFLNVYPNITLQMFKMTPLCRAIC